MGIVVYYDGLDRRRRSPYETRYILGHTRANVPSSVDLIDSSRSALFSPLGPNLDIEDNDGYSTRRNLFGRSKAVQALVSRYEKGTNKCAYCLKLEKLQWCSR